MGITAEDLDAPNDDLLHDDTTGTIVTTYSEDELPHLSSSPLQPQNSSNCHTLTDDKADEDFSNTTKQSSSRPRTLFISVP